MSDWPVLSLPPSWRARARQYSIFFFLILALAMTGFFYFDVVFGAKTLLTPGLTAGVMGDSGPYGFTPPPDAWNHYGAFYKDMGSNAWAGEPPAAKVRQAIGERALPLWNDNVQMGKPLAANFLSNPFFPLKSVLYLFPGALGWDGYLLLRLALGLFFTFLFLRLLNVGILPAFLGGISFAFSGFFVLLLNIQDLDVGLLTPLMFWVVAYSLRQAREERVQAGPYLAAVAALTTILLANIPQPLILVLIAGFSYWLYRLIALARSGRHPLFRKALGYSLRVVIPAILIVLPLYLINSEFLQQAVTTHTKEVRHGLSIWWTIKSAVSNVLPYLNSQPLFLPRSPVTSNTLNYLGLVGFFLAVIGAVVALKQRRSRLFLLVLFGLTFAKIYGLAPVHQFLGSLPGLELILFPKYGQSILSFSAACLVAFGLQALQQGRLSLRLYWLAGGVFVGLIFWGLIELMPAVDWPLFTPQSPLSPGNSHLLVSFVSGLLVLGTLLILIGQERFRLVGASLLALLVISELWLYVPRAGRPERYQSFTPPPFVTFLQSQPQPFRIFAFNRLLYPQISSAFDLDDIRDLDALYVRPYFTYIKEFISPSIVDRFTGASEGPKENQPVNVRDNPLFDLTNVRYLIAKDPPPELFPPGEINQLIFAQQAPTPEVREATFAIGDEEKPVFFQHPPAKTCLSLPLRREAPFLHFALGVDPKTWELPGSDGVNFAIEDGVGKRLFSFRLDPHRESDHRRWIVQRLDLSGHLDRPQPICFTTEAGATTLGDWAGWGDLRLGGETPPAPARDNQYKLIYNQEVRIYENADSLPRAFTVGRVTEQSGLPAIIQAMKQPGFDPKNEAVIWPKKDQAGPSALEGGRCLQGQLKDYRRPRPGEISFAFTSPGRCFLVASETIYPGWVARVDGAPTAIYQTDLLFRGLVLTQGDHRVEFVYRPPLFYGGLIATASGLLLALVWAWPKRA